MKRSTARILTTHVGSLIRTPEILQGMKARTLGQPNDQTQLAADVRAGIIEVVRKQIAVGIDIPNDGEFARHGFSTYIHERLAGLEPREIDPRDDPFGAADVAERRVFPEFFEQYFAHYRHLWMLPEVSIAELPNRPGNYERFKVVGPISYRGHDAVRRDIETLQTALAGLPHADAFMTAVPPTGRTTDADILKFYPSESAYMYAIADALREEYKAITDAGFILQLDLAATAIANKFAIEERVEVVNYALRGIPAEQVRYHHCWGSMNSPHTQDVPLSKFVEHMLKINAQAYSIEAANPRHEHEWMVWRDVRLPDGKVLIPGVISHQTNVVEHPDLVAWRIKNYASVVGRENVIAGADCGFSQHWDAIRVHPTVQWAKLQALVEGAALASADLWGQPAESVRESVAAARSSI
jgi:5-methyltetrahydropteroyltriglutamate--homocysteine methyltransferase